MLNPIDTKAVIRDGGAVGRFPGEIHEGVAWWLGASFVVVARAAHLAVGGDGRPTTTGFSRRLCKGAINAHHYACQVTSINGEVTEEAFLSHLRHLAVPGAYLTTGESDGGQVMQIRLYTRDGQLLHDETGLARIRSMIAEDRVPIPVNEGAKGSITHVAVQALEGAR